MTASKTIGSDSASIDPSPAKVGNTLGVAYAIVALASSSTAVVIPTIRRNCRDRHRFCPSIFLYHVCLDKFRKTIYVRVLRLVYVLTALLIPIVGLKLLFY